MRAAAEPPTQQDRRQKAPWRDGSNPGRLLVAPGAADAHGVVEGFGPHLVFDGYGCSPERLGDMAEIYALLDTLPARIRMTKIMPPYVFRHATPGRGGDGVSGFVLIAESHIAVHTFPRPRFLNVDVFSCQTFDVELVLAALKEVFTPRRVEWKLLDRGLEFPKTIGSARAGVMQDRAWVARSLGLEALR